MDIKKIVTIKAVPEHQKEEYDYTACDKCGLDVDRDRNHWSHHSSVTIEGEIGEVYPEGSFLEGWKIDCCFQCFEEDVVPTLKSIGFDIKDKGSV